VVARADRQPHEQTMLNWSDTLYAIHVLVAVAAAWGFFRYWHRTKFWLPRYIHYLAAIALAVGIYMETIVPPDAPINQGEWRELKRALSVLVFPALVYLFFVFYGGQQAAHEIARPPVRCEYCGQADVVPSMSCVHCGQTSTRQTGDL
jgi:hypothetical protein